MCRVRYLFQLIIVFSIVLFFSDFFVPVELYTVFSGPKTLVKNLAKNLIKNLTKNLVKNLAKNLDPKMKNTSGRSIPEVSFNLLHPVIGIRVSSISDVKLGFYT